VAFVWRAANLAEDKDAGDKGEGVAGAGASGGSSGIKDKENADLDGDEGTGEEEVEGDPGILPSGAQVTTPRKD